MEDKKIPEELTQIGHLVAVDGNLIPADLLKDADFKEEGADLFESPECSGPSEKDKCTIKNEDGLDVCKTSEQPK